MRIVQVVAAALVDGEGRVLLAQRPEGKAMAGLWEFPGGKIEAGETPEAALIRELDEELAVAVAADDLVPLAFVSHRYDAFHLVMLLYLCRHWQGVPMSAIDQALRWESPATMDGLAMPAADVPLVAALRNALRPESDVAAV